MQSRNEHLDLRWQKSVVALVLRLCRRRNDLEYNTHSHTH